MSSGLMSSGLSVYFALSICFGVCRLIVSVFRIHKISLLKYPLLSRHCKRILKTPTLVRADIHRSGSIMWE